MKEYEKVPEVETELYARATGALQDEIDEELLIEDPEKEIAKKILKK